MIGFIPTPAFGNVYSGNTSQIQKKLYGEKNLNKSMEGKWR